MATLGSNMLTLTDYARRVDESGKIQSITEMLSVTNEVLMDMVWREGNLQTGERYTVRNSLPTVYWRKINEGTSPSKSTTSQVTETCGILDAWSEVDKELADLGGNAKAFRLSESRAFIEAMGIEAAQTIFYGNQATAPEEFTGFAPRYNSRTGTFAENVIHGGGSSTDNSSIWLVGWGDSTCYGFFPRGTQAGIEHKDWGVGIVETTAGVAGNRMVAYRDQYIWRMGLAVRDWRYVVRIPNIDISSLVAKTSAADLLELMVKAIHRLPSLTNCRPVFYMNRTVFQMLDIQTRDDVISGGGLKFENVEGRPQRTFRGIPVRICDALVEDEALVTT